MPDQRFHNVNILVACAGPDKGEELETRYGPMVSRAGTKLKHTMSDVELMDRYWSVRTPAIQPLAVAASTPPSPTAHQYRDISPFRSPSRNHTQRIIF